MESMIINVRKIRSSRAEQAGSMNPISVSGGLLLGAVFEMWTQVYKINPLPGADHNQKEKGCHDPT